MTQKSRQADSNETEQHVEAKPFCGVVRPISDTDGYPAGHWAEVHQIIAEAADIAGFKARIVSDSDAIGVIMGRIVDNLHDDPITVIDVSSLNPNVMFELGMRLTFDKPVVVIKDTVTLYPFDASPLEYLSYPADLRHAPLMTFREKLATMIRKTADAPTKPGYRSFLKHFGALKPGELGAEQTIDTRLILDELQSLKATMRRSEPIISPGLQKRREQWERNRAAHDGRSSMRFKAPTTVATNPLFMDGIRALPGVLDVRRLSSSTQYTIIEITYVADPEVQDDIMATVSRMEAEFIGGPS